ncbi:oxalate decarboxylase/phosphoglucose isomerase-like protein (cupin superfamily) [Bacillus pakistanensis]|uniref:Oxalate decarboxylase/phosphoglucose isomerase-like protein (Cupin superfamily) n=1 Tax=Rossellomorea pakistanensis TaxID=992288 RepID=A0ABS2NFA8_9BACI|nr:CotO family spore coat protein [Bacillus pakistanensis]MBM7586547.1 oxalate decarboxylase/phosphoglucose isomerase-like protein (cupin superfamily) [Bacillus pakistanensis]
MGYDEVKRRDPLLYINQPKMQEAKANMQDMFRSKRQDPVKKEKAKMIAKRVMKPADDHEAVVQDSFKLSEKDKQEELKGALAFHRVKPFKEMNLEERIEYLLVTISGRPPFPCEYITEEGSFRGIIQKHDGEAIEVKTFQGDNVRIKKSALHEIKMIGL